MKEQSKTCNIREEWECSITTKLKINIRQKNNSNTKKTNKEKLERTNKAEFLHVDSASSVIYHIPLFTLISRQNMMEIYLKERFEELMEAELKKEEDQKM